MAIDSVDTNIFAAHDDCPAIYRGATKQRRINPVLRYESPIDRALFRSPQIYLQAFSAKQGDVFTC
jgi:hypothetical protein